MLAGHARSRAVDGKSRPAQRFSVRNSLLRKYAAYLVSLVAAALLASGLVSLHYTYSESKDARLRLQREKAYAAASQIVRYMKEVERQLVGVRDVPVSADLSQLLGLFWQVPAIDQVMVVDSLGRERRRLRRYDVNVLDGYADMSGVPAFTKATSDSLYRSSVYFRQDSEPHVTLAVRGTGERANVTIAEVSLKHVGEVVSRIEVGRQGLAYVVDERGRLIGHPDTTRPLKKDDLSARPAVKAAISGEHSDVEPVMAGEGDGGREALIAYATIRDLRWHVFVEQPLSEAFGPLYAALMRTGVLLLLGLLLAVAVSVALARHMVTPIRAIQAGAARVARGDLEQRIQVDTGDELQALGQEFNEMTRLLSESYASLEAKVDARTRDLSFALDQQTATADVLRVLSDSPTEIQPVLDAVVHKAARLCSADDVVVRLADAGVSRLVAHHGTLPAAVTRRITRASISGRALIERTTVEVDDATSALHQAEYPDGDAGAGARSMVAVPLVNEDRAEGAIVMRRTEARPFAEREVKLLETFAAQASIALRNARLYHELERKSRELELADRHKSQFLANVSHELRTPLNAIIGFSEVLRARMFGELNKKQAEYIDDIHSSGRHLLALINDILNLAKIEAGRMDLELSRFDVAAAIHSALGVVRERANRQGITLVFEPDETLGQWVADERKFKQIMLNLLSNAVKFTPDRGRVEVQATTTNAALEVSVVDTGVGIAPQHLSTIFDEFRQLDPGNPRSEEGTGLGLPLTRRLVELHGGTMAVQSEVGVGSTFRFALPANAREAA